MSNWNHHYKNILWYIRFDWKNGQDHDKDAAARKHVSYLKTTSIIMKGESMIIKYQDK